MSRIEMNTKNIDYITLERVKPTELVYFEAVPEKAFKFLFIKIVTIPYQPAGWGRKGSKPEGHPISGWWTPDRRSHKTIINEGYYFIKQHRNGHKEVMHKSSVYVRKAHTSNFVRFDSDNEAFDLLNKIKAKSGDNFQTIIK